MGPSKNIVQGFFERYIQKRGFNWGVYKPEDIAAESISSYPKLKLVAQCLRDLQEIKENPTEADWLALHAKFKNYFDKEPKNTGVVGFLYSLAGQVYNPYICEYLHYAMSYISSEISLTASEDKTYHLDNFANYSAGKEKVFAHFVDTFNDVDKNNFEFCDKLIEVTKGSDLLNDSESKATPSQSISADQEQKSTSSSASIAASLSVASPIPVPSLIAGSSSSSAAQTVLSPEVAGTNSAMIPALSPETSSSSSAMAPSSHAESLASSDSPAPTTPTPLSVAPTPASSSSKKTSKPPVTKTKSGKRQFIPRKVPISGTSPTLPPPSFLADSSAEPVEERKNNDSQASSFRRIMSTRP